MPMLTHVDNKVRMAFLEALLSEGQPISNIPTIVSIFHSRPYKKEPINFN